MEVMNGASIILLLGCGVIAVSAGSLSRPNPNAYPGPVGRRSQNFNSNVNTNIVSGAPSKPTEEEPNPTLEEISRKLYSEADPKTASLATSAAEAAMSIVKALTAELSETAAAAVAEAVSRILTGRSESVYARRNYNVNTNTNTNIMGHGGERSEDRDTSSDRPSSADLLDLGNSLGTQSSDPGLGSSNGFPYGTIVFDSPNVYGNELTARAIEGITREPDVDEDEEDKVTSLERLREPDELENEALASKSMGGHGWPRVNPRNIINPTASKIRPNHHRRSSIDENEETDLRSSAYRRRVNPNGNPSATGLRHNINSNSNSNSSDFRRNVNSRMSRRSRSRRD